MNKKQKLTTILMALIMLIAISIGGNQPASAAKRKVGKVTNVSVTSRPDQTLLLSWKAVKGATGYCVYKSEKKNGYYKRVAVLKANKLKYNDKKVKCGKTYYYKIRAKKVNTLGEESKIIVGKPKWVLGNTSINYVKSKSYNSVKISWKAVKGAEGYVVCKATEKGGRLAEVKTVKGNSKTSVTLSGLVTGKPYYFGIKAYKTVKGQKIIADSCETVYGMAVPNTITTKNIGLISASSAKMNWLYGSGAEGYYIYRSTNPDSGYKKIATIKSKITKEYVDKGLKMGTTYYYKVASYKSYGKTKCTSELSKPMKLEVTNTYTIGPDSVPYGGAYMENPNYKSSTKQYYTWLSYMDLIEAMGGGTINVTAGTYKFWKPIYIPSNTTINFNDGVTITSYGSAGAKENLFVLANRGEVEDNNVKYKGFGGAHDITLRGTGNVVIDKNYTASSAILIGHTKNILIDGITFKNMNGSAHFIELDASKNVTITNCVFKDFKDTGADKEAINIDIPDKNTEGFSGTFSSFDNTPNEDIIISKNVFENLPVAVGTHMYTPGRMHNRIHITNNTIKNCKCYGIRIMNWKDSEVTGNTISNVRSTKMEALAFLVNGMKDCMIFENKVSNCDRFMIIKVAVFSDETIKAHPALADYAPLENKVKSADVIFNTISNIDYEGDIYYSNTLDFSDKVYWYVKSK